jgi:hypothetical protein
MSQSHTVGTHKTKVRTNGEYPNGVTSVTYHNTDVVKFTNEWIVLDSGGWQTFTTKARMVQAANQFGLGFTVYQKNFEWFVARFGDWDNPIPFVDGMVLTRGKQ